MNWFVSWNIIDVDFPVAGNDCFRVGLFKGPPKRHPPLYAENPTTPRDAPLVMDCEDFGDGVVWPSFERVDNPAWWPYIGGWSGFYYAFRHAGQTANFLYMDGHVEARKHVMHGGQPNKYRIWNSAPPSME
jgi:prepilin-type processing-associated H-X9-DG protein